MIAKVSVSHWALYREGERWKSIIWASLNRCQDLEWPMQWPTTRLYFKSPFSLYRLWKLRLIYKNRLKALARSYKAFSKHCLMAASLCRRSSGGCNPSIRDHRTPFWFISIELAHWLCKLGSLSIVSSMCTWHSNRAIYGRIRLRIA